MARRPKRILFLYDKAPVAKKKADPKTLASLLNNAAGSEAEYFYSIYEDLAYFLDTGSASVVDVKNNWDISDFDFVYQRRWGDRPELAMVCAMYLEKKAVPFMDPESNRPGSMDKLTQLWRLWLNDLPVPATYFMEDKPLTKWLNDTNLTKVGIPFIMKGINSTRGNDNYLVKNTTEAKRIAKTNPKIKFIIQKFIPNDGDYRVLVAGDKILMVIERVAAEGSHKNNTSQGAKAYLRETNIFKPRIKSDIIKAAKIFGRQLAGVDVAFDKNTNQHYFFEVNRAPQIDASSFTEEKVKKIHSYLMERINEEK